MPPWEATRASASSRERLARVPVKTKVMPAKRVDTRGLAFFLHVYADGAEMFDQFAIGGFGEKFADAFGNFGADFGDFHQFFEARFGQLGHGAEMLGEELRGAFAYEGHADGVDQTRESVLLAAGDFVCADFARIFRPCDRDFASVFRSSL